MKRLGRFYKPSPQELHPRLEDPRYPEHDDIVAINKYGQIWFRRSQGVLSSVLSYQHVGFNRMASSTCTCT